MLPRADRKVFLWYFWVSSMQPATFPPPPASYAAKTHPAHQLLQQWWCQSKLLQLHHLHCHHFYLNPMVSPTPPSLPAALSAVQKFTLTMMEVRTGWIDVSYIALYSHTFMFINIIQNSPLTLKLFSSKLTASQHDHLVEVAALPQTSQTAHLPSGHEYFYQSNIRVIGNL